MKDFRRIPSNRLRWYCGLDVASTLALYRHQRTRMGPFLDTWRRLHQPALEALARVERWGAILSEKNVAAYDTFLKAKLEKVREELRQYPEVPPDLNVKSPKQLQELLFGTLGLASVGRTDTGQPSVNKEALEVLAQRHPEVRCLPVIQEMITARSMLAMYGLGQLDYVGYDGRVHTKYKVIRSGRLSSSEPNLQNLKRVEELEDEQDDDGVWARGCWVPPEGWSWVNLDFSQLELRIWAILSGDPVMAAGFNSGVDYHRGTGAEIFQKSHELVTKEERAIAKTLNFKIPYGADEYGIANDPKARMTVEKAREYLAIHRDRYPVGWRWIRDMIAKAASCGDSWAVWEPNKWTHRRPVPDIAYPPRPSRGGLQKDPRAAHAERVAVNNIIQNVANCFALTGLCRVVSWLLDSGIPAEVNLTVHDSLALYVRNDHVEEVATVARDLMEDHDTGDVRLVVDVETSERSLGHLKKLQLPRKGAA